MKPLWLELTLDIPRVILSRFTAGWLLIVAAYQIMPRSLSAVWGIRDSRMKLQSEPPLLHYGDLIRQLLGRPGRSSTPPVPWEVVPMQLYPLPKMVPMSFASQTVGPLCAVAYTALYVIPTVPTYLRHFLACNTLQTLSTLIRPPRCLRLGTVGVAADTNQV